MRSYGPTGYGPGPAGSQCPALPLAPGGAGRAGRWRGSTPERPRLVPSWPRAPAARPAGVSQPPGRALRHQPGEPPRPWLHQRRPLRQSQADAHHPPCAAADKTLAPRAPAGSRLLPAGRCEHPAAATTARWHVPGHTARCGQAPLADGAAGPGAGCRPSHLPGTAGAAPSAPGLPAEPADRASLHGSHGRADAADATRLPAGRPAPQDGRRLAGPRGQGPWAGAPESPLR